MAWQLFLSYGKIHTIHLCENSLITKRNENHVNFKVIINLPRIAHEIKMSIENRNFIVLEKIFETFTINLNSKFKFFFVFYIFSYLFWRESHIKINKFHHFRDKIKMKLLLQSKEGHDIFNFRLCICIPTLYFFSLVNECVSLSDCAFIRACSKRGEIM